MQKPLISRRDFMGKAAGITGAMMAARSFELEASPIPARTTPAPSDTIRFGIIGVGMQGSGLLTTAITLPGVECVAACDLWDGRHTLAKEIAGPKIKVTRRYQELLDDKNIDCIIAAVPDHWHKQILVDTV